MATASSTYTWAAYGAALKTHLGVSGSGEDTTLTAYLAAAASDCDDFCGELPTTHSPKIWLGICEWVRAFRAWVLSPAAVGLQSVSTGALSETYSKKMGAALARSTAASLWMSSVADVSLLGPHNEPFGG